MDLKKEKRTRKIHWIYVSRKKIHKHNCYNKKKKKIENQSKINSKITTKINKKQQGQKQPL